MGAWRILGSLAVVLTTASGALAEKYRLAEPTQAGDCFQIKIEMSLKGKMLVTRNQEPLSIPLEATARHEFSERVLAVDANHAIQKTARVYTTARATVGVGSDKSAKTLRPERSLIVAQHYKGQSLVYSPSGPMTLEEVELTSEQMDTLCLTGLLPGREVAVGEQWKPGSDAVQALCNFEGLAGHDLSCKLDEVKDHVASISVTGSASGIDAGAMVKLTIRATCRFDLEKGRLIAVDWKQTDKRDQGPASPATEVESTTSLTREPIEEPTCLDDVALVPVPDGFEPPAAMTQVKYHRDGTGSFDLLYSRDWQLVAQTREHVILRLLDRGDFVAQATITPWDRARPKEHATIDAFREAMAKSPGWEQGEVEQEGEVPSENGAWIYRITAPGLLDKVKVVQNFYLVAGPDGDQVVVGFTMMPSQVEKLGTRDLTLVQGLSFSSGQRP